MEYIAFLPLFGPGLALVFYFVPDDKFNWVERIILGLGLSLAFYPVLFLLFYVAHIPVNRLVIYAVIMAGFILLGWQLYAARQKLSFAKKLSLGQIKLDIAVSWLFLLVTLALSAYVRIAVVKDLKIPMWADSYHHTMISQLMVDNKGLFSSWLPYVPLKTFTYHFGFHSLVVSYYWLTGAAITRAVIITGQMINFLMVLSGYLLARYLMGKVWAANFAALFIGLISPMPFYYFNWGRYPQLIGLALLPIAIVLTMDWFNQKGIDKRWAGLTALAIAGLGLSHYGVLIFYILFGVLFILFKFFEIQADWPAWRELTLKLLLVGLVAGLLTGPWLWNFFEGRFWFIITKTVERGANHPAVQASNVLNNVGLLLNTQWYVLGIVGGVWALWRREKWVILTFIWGLALILLARPHYLGLPGTGLINNFAIFISLFLPIAVILGNMVADLMAKMQSWQPWSIGLAALLLLAIGFHDVNFRLASFQPRHQLVTEQDLQAMAWIRENTLEDARFLANDFLTHNDSVVVGSDAGWWIPLLAKRQTNLPPMPYIKEIPYELDYFDKTKRFQQQTGMGRLLTEKGWQFVKEAHITHIYIGQQEGRVWYNGDKVLDAQKLEASPFYELVYHQDKVAILAVKTETP